MPDNPDRDVFDQSYRSGEGGQCPFCKYQLEDGLGRSPSPRFEISYDETSSETDGLAVCKTSRSDVMAVLLRHEEANVVEVDVTDPEGYVKLTPEEYRESQRGAVIGLEAWIPIDSVSEVLFSAGTSILRRGDNYGE